jgi:DNA-binding response OmpR family regulator
MNKVPLIPDPAMPPADSLPEQARILIVDDSVEDLHLLIEILREKRFRLTIAFDGKQGYQRAISTKPDLILLDVHMPNTDGLATCRLLKANTQTRDIPIIFLTAAAAPEERIRGLTAGGVDYVVKPFFAEEVLARINIHLNLVARTRLAQQPAAQEPAAPSEEVMVRAAVHYICANLEHPMTVSEIAAKVGSHEKKLSRVFREQVGLTVFAFIREERSRMSRKLLAETELSIQDIAVQVGFQNAGNFTTAFRERFHMTPSSFRQSLKKYAHMLQ